MWRIEFTSSKFLPALPEKCQQNPGIYGFELAWWLAVVLAKQGIATSYPAAEDWGWFLEFTDAQRPTFRIGCSSMTEQKQGQQGGAVGWSVFVEPHTSFTERLRGLSHEAATRELGDRIVAALASEKIEVERVGFDAS